MAVKYVRLPSNVSADRERVSAQWAVVLKDARKKIWFDINEGHRTFARQQQLVNQLGVWSYSNQTGAALPSHTAPHIRTGRIDHAIDADNAAGLVVQLRRMGIRATQPVPGEPWHIEAPTSDLVRYYEKHKGLPTLRRGDRGPAVKRLRKRLRRAGYGVSKTGGFGKNLTAVVKKFQREQSLKDDGIVGPATWRRLKKKNALPVLKRGTKNRRAVKALKRLMRRNGYRVKVSGRYGLTFRRKVNDFKEKQGWRRDGVAGPRVWKKLRKK